MPLINKTPRPFHKNAVAFPLKNGGACPEFKPKHTRWNFAWRKINIRLARKKILPGTKKSCA